MKAGLLVPFLVESLKHDRQVFLVGPPGGGKTAMIRKAVEILGWDSQVSHPAALDTTAHEGFPFKHEDGLHADFLPFGHMYSAMNATKPLVWVFDDFGQACDAIQKQCMQIFWGKELNGKKLSPHVHIIAASNDVGQNAGVTKIFETIKSRFHALIHVENDPDAWAMWAMGAGMPMILVAYIRARPAMLDFVVTKGMHMGPCARNWESFGQWLNCGMRDVEILEGTVGKGATLDFLNFEKLASKAPNLDGILLNPDTAEVPSSSDPDISFIVATGLAHKITPKNFGQALKYLGRMMAPYRIMAIKDAAFKTPAICQTAEFVAWSCNEGANL
jgi:tRNA A37 threonylcarbamoyladenosine biosynthesis protein TsaE